jgi:hypothetical protein
MPRMHPQLSPMIHPPVAGSTGNAPPPVRPPGSSGGAGSWLDEALVAGVSGVGALGCAAAAAPNPTITANRPALARSAIADLLFFVMLANYRRQVSHAHEPRGAGRGGRRMHLYCSGLTTNRAGRGWADSATASGGRGGSGLSILWMAISRSGMVVRDSAGTGNTADTPTVESDDAGAPADGNHGQGAGTTGRTAGVRWGRRCFAG